MTPIISKQALADLGAPDLVYVREVRAREVLGTGTVTQVRGLEIDADQILYAVHAADGERLAVLIDRDSAFAAAMAHALAPVSVH
ncbi:MAG: DUF1150 family protein [Brevundimonas sp.]|jgi:hypothetical protein|uniref:DUF1150 family protein n=1 Tax=Brevundimonas sp. TaxID=1871086 RepID=UPI0022C696FE|nr:DUF1150 family protein [Brevundimonas sp.]MCZ8087942.1 DUF1150 family protein [Brevundimonas sp.]MCZ8194013.1 DUF1150 family protein [Brevundimonas sp.]